MDLPDIGQLFDFDFLESGNADRFIEMLVKLDNHDHVTAEHSQESMFQQHQEQEYTQESQLEFLDTHLHNQTDRHLPIQEDKILDLPSTSSNPPYIYFSNEHEPTQMPNHIFDEPAGESIATRQNTQFETSKIHHRHDTPVNHDELYHKQISREFQTGDDLKMGYAVEHKVCNQRAVPHFEGLHVESGESSQVSSSTEKKPRSRGGVTLTPLPPCKVCGDKASGCHFGAITCEACKGFFRRCLKRKGELICPYSDNCDLRPHMRSLCPACRYRKCLEVGMSKDAVKIGRYTLERKSSYIKEVRQSGAEIKGVKRKQQQLAMESGVSKRSHFSSIHIIETILKAHMDQKIYSPDIIQKIMMQQMEYKSATADVRELLGDVVALSPEEYQEFFDSTGIDLDGRRQKMMSMFPQIEMALIKLTNFAKSVPGFPQICLSDQMELIKACIMDWWMINVHSTIDVEAGIIGNPTRFTLTVDDMHRFHGLHFAQEFFRVVEILQRNQLTDIEMAVMKAISLFSADRCDLKEARNIERCQEIIVDAAKNYILHSGEHLGDSLPKIFGILTELRSVYHMRKKAIPAYKRDWARDLPCPPLVQELCD